MKNHIIAKLKKSLILADLFMSAHVTLTANPVEKVWIDTDIAIGKFGKDVDDGIALIMALRSPGLHIVGISLVTEIEYGKEITDKLIQWYSKGEEIPIYKGASKAQDLGTTNEAVLALAQALKKDRLTIIALGPATNIATLLRLYPELAPRIKRIVWCAGRTPDLHFRPGNGKINICDCNFEKDPLAGEVLLASGVSLALTGYEAASYIRISKRELAPLKNSGLPRDRWLYRQLNRWADIWRILLGSKDGFMPFDAITLSSFLEPGYMEHYPDIPVTIKKFGNDARFYANKSRKPYLIASYQLESSQRADYFYKAREDLKEVILSLLIPKDSEPSMAQ